MEAASLDSARQQISFLIITATNLETKELHRNLKPFPGYGSRLMTTQGAHTYYLGTLGEYVVVHTQCEMGSVSAGASLAAASHGIDFWSPRAVLMVGIAFGTDKKHQRIGDVLVAKSVIPYDVRRQGKVEVVYRAAIPPSGAVLLDRFKNQPDWQHLCPNGKRSRIIVTDMLSGEALIDDKHFRDSLVQAFKTAKGGEMEGAGLVAAAHERAKEWVIVKGICDFADGNKKRKKATNQSIAVRSAISLCCHVFAKRSTFSALHCVPVLETTNKTTPANEEVVLFDIFKEECRPYYLERALDYTIGKIAKRGSLWITGPSGCGKTNAALFSLITGKLPFHFIDLSRCVGSSVRQLFGSIHMEVASGLGLPMPKSLDCHTDQILSGIGELFRSFSGTAPVLMIDEIPLSTHEEFKEFVEVMCGLMIHLRHDGHRARFVLASVEDPQTRLQAIHVKVREQMSFVSLPAWTNEDLETLLRLVLPDLRITFSASERTQIVEGAKGCPRTLKAILRNALLFSKDNAWPLDKIIQESRQAFAVHG